jgi:branched-chain amino acid transport system permease protein
MRRAPRSAESPARSSYLGYVDPRQFEFSFSILILAMVALGGLGSIPGAIVGAVVLSVLNNYLLPDVLADVPARFGFAFDLTAIRSGIYGAILVTVMLLRPQGLIPARGARRTPRALVAGRGR